LLNCFPHKVKNNEGGHTVTLVLLFSAYTWWLLSRYCVTVLQVSRCTLLTHIQHVLRSLLLPVHYRCQCIIDRNAHRNLISSKILM